LLDSSHPPLLHLFLFLRHFDFAPCFLGRSLQLCIADLGDTFMAHFGVKHSGQNEMIFGLNFFEASCLYLQLCSELVDKRLIVGNDIEQNNFFLIHILQRFLILFFGTLIS
jgi:hypothetical protein